LAYIFRESYTQKIGAIGYFKTLVPIYQFMLHQIPENGMLGVTVILSLCIWENTDFNLGWDTDNPEIVCNFSVLSDKCLVIP
jgi:hypothetical protein